MAASTTCPALDHLSDAVLHLKLVLFVGLRTRSELPCNNCLVNSSAPGVEAIALPAAMLQHERPQDSHCAFVLCLKACRVMC